MRRPFIFSLPIRDDIVRKVHTNMSKNRRQAHGVDPKAGHRHSAESWGTGRAVSRIPRISGGGTHRAGQGAFGNMCRGGHMFSPKKIWRRIHRKSSIGMKRYAVASAIAASGVASLVYARGHRIGTVKQVPLVIDHKTLVNVKKTKQAVQLLRKLGAYPDIKRVINSRTLRAGKGKMRNRRHSQRTGPLIVLPQSEDARPIARAFRNIPGIDTAVVTRLNLLRLAPGGHLGRFVIWDSNAFASLDRVFRRKKGFVVPKAKMELPSVVQIIRSIEVRRSLRRPMRKVKKVFKKRNPLRNFYAMMKLNPYVEQLRRRQLLNDRLIATKRRKIARIMARPKPSPELLAKIEAKRAKKEAKKKAKVNPFDYVIKDGKLVLKSKWKEERKAAKKAKIAAKKPKMVTNTAPTNPKRAALRRKKAKKAKAKKAKTPKTPIKHRLFSRKLHKKQVKKAFNKRTKKQRQVYKDILFA